ncbi:uncharacterized protein J3D65DRAFT_639550 [Phyllosticta citribraziliensis]|uniref:4a-hydroxytetrahydrobiopterin dehydratase n=1 Tax=Phyllosticta citribraziliensis TaxID=989973 RepID=A0ABR1L6B1_9PEZI
MAFTRRSSIFSKSTAIVHLAPLRLASPLPLHFRRSRHDSPDGPDQFSIFEEDLPQIQTPDEPSRPVWGWHNQPDQPKSQVGHKSQNRRRPQDGPKSEDGVQAKPGRRPPPLSIAHVKAELAETEWQISNNLCAIERRYVFRDFERAFKYMCLLGSRCRKSTGHFPMSSNWGNRLFIRWTSYNNTCITKSDIQMARVCDRLFNDSLAASDTEQPNNPFDQIPDDLEWKEDRQISFGQDYFYHARDSRDLWRWLPQVELYTQKTQEYPLWAISHNRLVWTSVLWDGKTGALKGLTKEDRQKWRPRTPIESVREPLYWLSNVADQVSQNWNRESWFEKRENPKRLPLRYSMARSAEKLEMEKSNQEKRPETEKNKQDKKPKKERPQPNKPQGRVKSFRIFVD